MESFIKSIEGRYLQIIETVIVLFLYFFLRWLLTKIVKSHLTRKLIHDSRGVIIRKIFRLFLLIITVIILLLIWGVDQSEIAVFLGSILAVVGVAFFAQWSILSNITSSIILFFSHPVKLNDQIVILEGKEYEIEGRVKNIGFMFITIETAEGEEITLPNNIFISKSIKTKGGNKSDETLDEFHD